MWRLLGRSSVCAARRARHAATTHGQPANWLPVTFAPLTPCARQAPAAFFGTAPAPPLPPPPTSWPVDTHLLVRKLEGAGLGTQQAEQLAAHICQVLMDSLERHSDKFASKTDAEKAAFVLTTLFETFKHEMKSQLEHHAAGMKRETDTLRAECEKVRTEMRYEVDKIAASQRLDLNLEKGRIRDELQTQNSRSVAVEVKLDKEVNAIRTSLEASKNDIIRYCVGTIVSLSAVGLGLLRLLL